VKILLFDIETVDLKANWGPMICAGYQWLEGYASSKVELIKRLDYRCKDALDDRKAIEELVHVMNQADVWVTWYGKRFDVKYIRARAAYWYLRKKIKETLRHAPQDLQHLDLWEACRGNFSISNNRLDTAAKHLGIEHRKTVLDIMLWSRASFTQDKEALEYIYTHCIADIDVLREIYETFRDMGILPRSGVNFSRYGPYGASQGSRSSLRNNGPCPRCGITVHATGEGLRQAITIEWQRIKLHPCGHWGQVPKTQDYKDPRNWR